MNEDWIACALSALRMSRRLDLDLSSPRIRCRREVCEETPSPGVLSASENSLLSKAFSPEAIPTADDRILGFLEREVA